MKDAKLDIFLIFNPYLHHQSSSAIFCRRFFDISLASIAETASAVDIMLAYRLIPASEAAAIKDDLNIAYAMAINLKRSAI